MDIGDLCDLCEEYGDHDCKRCKEFLSDDKEKRKAYVFW